MPKVLIDLDGDAFENPQTADDGDVEGGQREGELVHDVSKSTDDIFEVEFTNRSIQHIGQSVSESLHDRGRVDVSGNEAHAFVKCRQRHEIAVHQMHHCLYDAVSLTRLDVTDHA